MSNEPGQTPNAVTQPMDTAEEAPNQPSSATQMFRSLDQASSLVDEQNVADSTDSGEESDDSIQRYMADLLQRSGGHSETLPYVQKKAEEPAATTAGAAAAPSVPTEAPVESPGAPVPTEPYVQKAPPERRSDLSNMRELANLNTQHALGVHNERRLIFKMHSKLVIAIIAMVCSTVLAVAAPSSSSLLFYVSISGLLVALTFTGLYICMAHKLSTICKERAIGEAVMASPIETPESVEIDSPADPNG